MKKDILLMKKLLGIIVLFFIFFLLKELKFIFIPLTSSFLLGIVFSPMTRKLQRHNITKTLSIIIVSLIIIVTLLTFGTIVYTGINLFVQKFPVYETKIVNYSQNLISKFNIPIPDVKYYVKNDIKWFTVIEKMSLTKIASKTMGTFANSTSNLALTWLFLVFFLIEKDKFMKRFRQLNSKNDNNKSQYFATNLEKQVQTYLRNKAIISLLTSMTGMLILWIFKADFILLSGSLLFILNFIPNIGSIIASAFPILVYFVEYGADWKLFLLAIILILIQIIYGNFLEPKLMGTKLKISPLFILVSLMFWAWLWGPIGMVLAIPLTSILKLICEQFESLNLFTAIMGEIPQKSENENNN